MTDLERAESLLGGHTLCLTRGDEVIFSDKKGIAPMMDIISCGKDVSGFSAADVIVGKAAATLFVKAGVSAVYGAVMSLSAQKLLKENGVFVRYGQLTKQIINRQGTGPCPMEAAVLNVDDITTAYEILKEKYLLITKTHG